MNLVKQKSFSNEVVSCRNIVEIFEFMKKYIEKLEKP